MLPGLLHCVMLATIALMCVATSTHATAPTARLSWSKDAVVENLDAPPGAGTALYLRISSPPSGFTALASEVKWTPNSIFGPCYGLFADSALSHPDGWWEWQTPPLALGPDSSYHYALHPRESGGDIVVKMMFGGGAGCGSTPATICLSMVKFVQASGETTYAEILGSATVLGGDGDCGIAMQSVTPTVVEEGEACTFSILGGGFSEGTTARLVGAAEVRDATSLVVEGPGRLQATFDTRSLVGSAELVVVSASGDSASTTTAILSGSSGAAYDPHTMILWTRPGQLTLPQGEVGSALAYASATPALLAQLEMLGVVAVRSCAPSFLEDPVAATELADPALLDVFVLDLADTNVVAACEALAADTANVRASHPNWLFTTMDVVPTDQLMPKSWHLRNTGSFPPLAGAVAGADSRAARAWELSAGATPVKIGVIDTGSWVTHPDLAGRYFNLWRSDFTPSHNDDAGHGAPVAGIIAAAGNGGGRAVGVNWSAEIYSLKAGNTYGEFNVADVIIAITTATAYGLKFVNMSFAVSGLARQTRGMEPSKRQCSTPSMLGYSSRPRAGIWTPAWAAGRDTLPITTPMSSRSARVSGLTNAGSTARSPGGHGATRSNPSIHCPRAIRSGAIICGSWPRADGSFRALVEAPGTPSLILCCCGCRGGPAITPSSTTTRPGGGSGAHPRLHPS